MSNHTPGPWKATCLDREDERRTLFWDIEQVRKPGQGYRGGIGTIHASEHIGGVTIEERDANARLIAAAPDLLEALKDLIDDLEIRSTKGVVNCSHGVYCSARQAIAKAEGRS